MTTMRPVLPPLLHRVFGAISRQPLQWRNGPNPFLPQAPALGVGCESSQIPMPRP